MDQCRHCGYTGRPRWSSRWLAVVAAVVWLIPLAFLSQGFYPFMVVPAIALTIWAAIAIKRVCPSCGKLWRG